MPRIHRHDFLDLRRGLIRMSWNKYNLYNLASRRKANDLNRSSVFNQKWIAKREVRGYHSPEVSQRQLLARHFKTKLRLPDLTKAQKQALPPIQTLAFGELERRMDVVVFRSHFATSTRQARHLITSGKVYLNGKKCRVPSTNLRDGDMVTVRPDAIPLLQDKSISKDTPNRPFKPHPYMTPWSFVPEYLEVNYSTCSTIFLRSPSPRPGKTEIPSPHPPSLHQLAYEWYSRIKLTQTKQRVIPDLFVNGRHVRLKEKFDEIKRREQMTEIAEKRELMKQGWYVPLDGKVGESEKKNAI